MEAAQPRLAPNLEKWAGRVPRSLPRTPSRGCPRGQPSASSSRVSRSPSLAVDRSGPMRGKGWPEANWRPASHLGQPWGGPDSALCPIPPMRHRVTEGTGETVVPRGDPSLPGLPPLPLGQAAPLSAPAGVALGPRGLHVAAEQQAAWLGPAPAKQGHLGRGRPPWALSQPRLRCRLLPGVSEVDYCLYPARETQLQWLRYYLQAQRGTAVTASEVQRLYVQVNKFALASHFFWALWALIQNQFSTIDFDFLRYAVIRFDQYFKVKPQVSALEMPK